MNIIQSKTYIIQSGIVNCKSASQITSPPTLVCDKKTFKVASDEIKKTFKVASVEINILQIACLIMKCIL